MSVLDWIALVILCLEIPIPFFWLGVHPFVHFWRRNPGNVYRIVAPLMWIAGGWLLIVKRRVLLGSSETPQWAVAIGLTLIAVDIMMLFLVYRELGGSRLVGQAELKTVRKLHTTGLYACMRHPRYAAMISGVFGACLMAGTTLLWVVAALWLIAALAAVRFEEREMRARFRGEYDEYARRVPGLLPFRLTN